MEFVVKPDARFGARFGNYRCAVGRSGIGHKHSEGDGLTPIGVWPVRYVFYRPDRRSKPDTTLALRTLSPVDGWCDAPDDPHYNQLVKRPYPASHEALWRDDRLYDLIVVLGFNDDPVIPGKGSAIFLHVARDDYSPTEGCIALALPDLLAVLRVAAPDSTVRVEA
jgi:L,D-peptidoglycan transpeptidase YkuD (ErfK/YbiS/YcfS/YnhG family)